MHKEDRIGPKGSYFLAERNLGMLTQLMGGNQEKSEGGVNNEVAKKSSPGSAGRGFNLGIGG